MDEDIKYETLDLTVSQNAPQPSYQNFMVEDDDEYQDEGTNMALCMLQDQDENVYYSGTTKLERFDQDYQQTHPAQISYNGSSLANDETSFPTNSALALCPTSYDDGSNSMGTLNTNEGTEYVQLHEILEKQEEDFDFSEMQPTEREKTEVNWNIFRLSHVMERLNDPATDYDDNLDSLLKLNMTIQQRTKNVIKKLQSELGRIRERKMVIDARMMAERKLARKYLKPIMLNHFRKGYFVDKRGWNTPLSVNDRGLEKYSLLHPFDPTNSEPPQKWKKSEDKRLCNAVTAAVSRPIVNDVKNKIHKDAENKETQDQIDELNDHLKDIRKKSDRDLIGGRHKDFDWEGIAITDMEDKKSAVECHLRWRNALHPDIRRNAFSKSESADLTKWVNKFGTYGKWKEIAEKMQGRTALACFTEYKKKCVLNEKGRPWTPEEDQKLIDGVELVRSNDAVGISWNAVAHYVDGRTPNQCTHRYKKSADPNILRGAWSRDEDIALLKATHLMGEEWSKIRDSNVVPGRTDMQLRDRYHNALCSGHQRGPWTQEEDILLKEGYDLYGTQWTLVGIHVRSRNDGQCLKRWTLREEYAKKKKPMRYVKSSKVCKLTRVNELRAAIRAEMEIKKRNEQLLQDPDLVILNKDTSYNDSLAIIEENAQYIYQNMTENPPAMLPSGQEGPLPIEQTPIGQSSQEKTYLEGKDIRPETHQALRQMCSKMYQPERAASYGRFMRKVTEILQVKSKTKSTLYRKHLRKVLGVTPDRVKKYQNGENIFLPPSITSVRLAKHLTSGVKLEKLQEKIPKSEQNLNIELDKKQELKIMLQTFLLMTMVQKRKYPGVRLTAKACTGFNRALLHEAVASQNSADHQPLALKNEENHPEEINECSAADSSLDRMLEESSRPLELSAPELPVQTVDKIDEKEKVEESEIVLQADEDLNDEKSQITTVESSDGSVAVYDELILPA